MTLTNPTERDIELTPCPNYLVIVTEAPWKTANRLNCAGAHPVPAGGTESFAMQIAIPNTAHLGPATVTWTWMGPLPPADDRPAARFTITAPQ